jgi:hypothetical protein
VAWHCWDNTHEPASRITFALGSVLLVSSAQLGMRWSMSHLPSPEQWLSAPIDLAAVAVVLAADPCLCPFNAQLAPRPA